MAALVPLLICCGVIAVLLIFVTLSGRGR